MYVNRLPNKVISRTYLRRPLAFPLQKACTAISRDQCPYVRTGNRLTRVIERVVQTDVSIATKEIALSAGRRHNNYFKQRVQSARSVSMGIVNGRGFLFTADAALLVAPYFLFDVRENELPLLNRRLLLANNSIDRFVMKIIKFLHATYYDCKLIFTTCTMKEMMSQSFLNRR